MIFALALLAEFFISHPIFPKHPICYIGNLFEPMENLAKKSKYVKLSGALCLIALCLAIYALTFFVTNLPLLKYFFNFYLIFCGLALGELVRKISHAAYCVHFETIEQARVEVSYLVSRDTNNMKKEELYRSLAESVSENFNDAFLAPLFWLMIFGVPFLWVYKVISTADSIWGYKTERFKDLGFFGAKSDDFLAYFPARISAILLILFAKNEQRKNLPKLSTLIAQAKKMPSPNSGYPMVVCAWLFDTKFGGPTSYHGKIINKPILGPLNQNTWDYEKLSKLIQHIKFTGIITAVFCIIIQLL